MRRKVLSMRISAIIMSAVLNISSVVVYADTTNRHILEGNNAIEVILPAGIDLNRDGNKFTGSGDVLAMYNYGTGHNAYEDKVDSLMVTVDASVDYINMEDSSKKVTGIVSFGESGVAVWSVDEIDNMAVKEIIVEAPLPKSGGTYEGVINYTIVSDGSAGFSLRSEVDLSEYEEMTLDSETILYADMDKDSEVIEKLKGKSKVYIISSEEEDNGIWYEIYTSDEVRGWIFLEDSGVEDSTEDEIDLSQYEEMTIDTATSLYADKDTDSDIVDSPDAGSVVYVISSKETGSGIWYEVYTSDEVRGWVFIENTGVEDSSGEDSTETEEETDTEDSTDEEMENEENTEDETETEESTEDEESSDETTETEEGSDESSETEESSDDSSETEESSDGDADLEEGTESEENTEIEDAEESPSEESVISEDSESDEITTEQEDLGVETISEEAEEVVIESDGEEIPEDSNSDIPQVLIEAEIRDESQE
ncbi:MAG: GW dipeptide domain-containing protein [Lachnospiraceae bacterium]|nr:GW dipeptide domain-containing protein [Lachnospiraceae bacterium]